MEGTVGEGINSTQRKRSRRTGWDVEEPVKIPKIEGSSTEPSYAALEISKSQIPAAVSSQVPSAVTAPSVDGNFAAVNAQLLAQQVLAKSGLIAATSGVIQPPKLENRIYVGSLHYSLRDVEIIALFSAFGPVVKCDMSYDTALGRSKGFCFVEFQDAATAQAAMAMDGFELAGRKIKVGRPSHLSPTGAAPMLSTPMLQLGIPALSMSQPGIQVMPPTLAVPPASSSQPVAAATSSLNTPFVYIRNVRTAIAISEIEEIFGLHGGIRSIKQLESAQLDPSLYYDVLLEYNDGANVASKAATTMNGYVLSKTQLIVEAIPLSRAVDLMIKKVEATTALQSKTVLLADMVTLEDMQDPDLKGEIEEEANKYGNLELVNISVVDGQAIVKLVYVEAAQATKACKALNGRGFAGRKIKATLQQ